MYKFIYLGLINAGYVHNHARMYIASYVVHFRMINGKYGQNGY